MGGIRGALFPPTPGRINWAELGWVCQLEKEAELRGSETQRYRACLAGAKTWLSSLALQKPDQNIQTNAPWNPCVGNRLHKAAGTDETEDQGAVLTSTLKDC